MTNEQLQEEIARLKNERYRLRSALGYIVGLFHDSEHEAKTVAQRALASAAIEPTVSPAEAFARLREAGGEVLDGTDALAAAEAEVGRCPTCSRWLEQRCSVCGPVENRLAEPTVRRSGLCIECGNDSAVLCSPCATASDNR